MNGRRVGLAVVMTLVLVGCPSGRAPSRDAGPPDVPSLFDAGTDAAIRLDAPSLVDAPDARPSDAGVPPDVRIADAGRDAPLPSDAGGGADGGGYVLATWGTSATGVACTAGSTYRFWCPPAGTTGSLWGTGEYTSDSSICNAAVHAGHITRAAGGDITITMRPGRSAYLGSTRNGTTSSSYGSWSCSFAVTGPTCSGTTCSDVCIADPSTDSFGCGASCTTCAAGQACTGGTCTCAVAGQMSCGGTCVDTTTSTTHCGGCSMPCPATQVCAGGSCGCPVGRTLCPTTGTTCIDTSADTAHCGSCGAPCPGGMTCAGGVCGALPATWSTSATTHSCPADVGVAFSYACPAGGTAGSLWGTDVYTYDSSICDAVHAGRITLAAGGIVTITIAPGAASYTGSLRNGITSSSWPAYSCSFTFP